MVHEQVLDEVADLATDDGDGLPALEWKAMRRAGHENPFSDEQQEERRSRSKAWVDEHGESIRSLPRKERRERAKAAARELANGEKVELQQMAAAAGKDQAYGSILIALAILCYLVQIIWYLRHWN